MKTPWNSQQLDRNDNHFGSQWQNHELENVEKKEMLVVSDPQVERDTDSSEQREYSDYA